MPYYGTLDQALAADDVANAAPECWDRFDDVADGAPTTARSGQSWLMWGGSVGAAANPTVVSGKLTSTPASSAGYAQLPTSRSLRRIGGKFTLGPYTTNSGSVVLIGWKQSINSTWPTIPDSPLHLAINATGWIYGVWSGNAMTQVQSGTFATPLTADGVTEYTAEVFIDKPNATATVILPDGNVVTVSHALIGTVATTHACWETYQQVSTDTHGAWSDVWADSKRRDALPVVRSLAQTRGLPAVGMFAPTGGDLVVPTTGTNVPELTATFTLPGDCTAILVEIEGFLSITAATRVLWSYQEGSTTFGTASVADSASFKGRVGYSHKRTGLAPGSSHTYVFRHFATAAGATLKLDNPNGYFITMKVTPLPS